MKSIQFILLPMVLLGSMFFASLSERQDPSNPNVLETIRSTFVRNLEIFDASIYDLEDAIQGYAQGKRAHEALQEQMIQTRLAYKRLEFLAEYFQPESIKRYINGAPLPKTNPVVPAIEVIPPSGLQTLDEAVFADEPDVEELQKLIEKLIDQKKDVIGYLRSKTIEHRYVFEAARFQINRIFTLGLTGFDTPGSVNGIQESKRSLLPIYEAFMAYENFGDPASEVIRKRIVRNLKEASIYLVQHNDFDNFDRLAFYTDYIRPLYKDIYELQSAYHIEFVDEVDPTNSAVNYHASSLFDEDYLNPPFFAEIAESDLMDPVKVELGKILFFDPALSKNGSMSCASCHHPEKAFTDGLPKSKSNTEGLFTQRNAPTLVNSVYSTHYFWDLREYDLERQVKHVVMDDKEFNMNFVDLAERLQESEEYVALFKEAYGDRDKYGISTWSISNALAAYVTSLSSWNSTFDQYMRGELAELDPEVKKGFNLFMGKAACGTCHFAPAFNGTVPPLYQDSESEVLGVTTTLDTLNPTLDPDLGRIANGFPRDEAPFMAHAFKTVTVRNAKLTAPYMHNGAFQTLEEVLHFYNKGGGAGMGLDIPNQTLPDAHLNLTQDEMDAIITFMESLTDIDDLQDRPEQFPTFPEGVSWGGRSLNY